jgi:hypothetical protein
VALDAFRAVKTVNPPPANEAGNVLPFAFTLQKALVDCQSGEPQRR